MYIEMNPTGLTLTDLICVAHRKRSEDTGFPYAVQSCRCSNCRYVSEGKCSLMFGLHTRYWRAKQQRTESIEVLKRLRGRYVMTTDKMIQHRNGIRHENIVDFIMNDNAF